MPPDLPLPSPWPARHRLGATALLALTCALLTGCLRQPPTGLLLRDVAVVDPDRGTVEGGLSIRIEDDRISAIGPIALLDESAGARASLERALEVHPGYTKARDQLEALAGESEAASE